MHTGINPLRWARVKGTAEVYPIDSNTVQYSYPEPDGLTNVSGAADKLRAQLTQQLRVARVSQEEAWEAQLLLNMLGHLKAQARGQYFTDVLFE